MPARSIGSATISFGLVSVPVNLFSTAESSATVSFNMVHKTCGTRLKQQYICPKDNVVVEKDDIAKGYEFAKGQFVLFTPEELKALDEKATNSSDIGEFIPLSEVDRIWLDRAYFLGPDKGGERAYKLLVEALKSSGRAAVGQYAARGKQNLVLVRPMGDVLVMEQLHYANEIRSPAEVPLGEATIKDTELKLARQLIDQGATEEFQPEKYKDQVRDRVLEAIQGKVEGHELVSEPQAEHGTKIIDLMEALKASINQAGIDTSKKQPAHRSPESETKGKKKTRRAS